ncbi:MAG: O-antigen ligase family protein [Pseudomonadota bacterium]|nr:O-antigen ligase family protein [Pseudomonadota bacterium]
MSRELMDARKIDVNENARQCVEAPIWFLDLTAWTAAVAVSGYPVAALISTYAGVSDNSVSVIFRLFVVGLAAVAFWRGAARAPMVAPDGWLMLFLLVYATRLIWDFTEPDVVGVDFAIQNFIAAAMIPAFAIALHVRSWDERNVAWCFLTVGTLVCAGGLWLNAAGLAGDAVLYDTTGRLSFEKVNPITLGHVACTTVLAALVLGPDRGSKLFRGLMLACAGVALWMLYLAASRGPVVSLVCCLAAYSLARGAWAHALAIAVAIYVAIGVLELVDVGSLAETLRFTEVGTDASSLDRFQEIDEALEEFEENPWLGSSYALPSGGWPHNIFVEAAMATGVPGLALFVIVSLRSLSASLWAFNAGYRFAALLLVQFLVAGQFSGSLWGLPGLWIGVAVLMALRRNDLPNAVFLVPR